MLQVGATGIKMEIDYQNPIDIYAIGAGIA
jgi:hypothetical protein